MFEIIRERAFGMPRRNGNAEDSRDNTDSNLVSRVVPKESFNMAISDSLPFKVAKSWPKIASPTLSSENPFILNDHSKEGS